MSVKHAAVLILAAACLGMHVHAQAKDNSIPDLMSPGMLPELEFGSHSAPITIIEYTSISCEDCRAFHLDTWPILKRQYIDTGQLRFIIRELPEGAAGTSAAMLARCVGNERWHPVIDILYQTQANWRQAKDPDAALLSVMSRTGMKETAFRSCLKDLDLRAQFAEVADKARKLGVTSSPALVINGVVHPGTHTLAQIQMLLHQLGTSPGASGAN